MLEPKDSGYADGYIESVKTPVDVYEFIRRYECPGGPRELTAYPDGPRYSIGCGTPSYKGERITEKEALRRFKEYVDIRVALVSKHYPKLTGDRKTAMVSLAANNGTCYYWFLKQWVNQYTWREKCDNIRNKEGKLEELRGLHLRRNAEADLYF